MSDESKKVEQIEPSSELTEQDLDKVAGGIADEAGLSGSVSSYMVTKKAPPTTVGKAGGPVKSL